MSRDEILASVLKLLADEKTDADSMTIPAPPTSPKMRTLPQAIAEIRADDPKTAITLSALRRAVKTGKIPTVTVASKSLVDLNAVFDYFINGEQLRRGDEYGKIRKIGG